VQLVAYAIAFCDQATFGIDRGDGVPVEPNCTARLCRAQQEIVEEQARHPSCGVGQREGMASSSTDDPTAFDTRGAGAIDCVEHAERLEHRKRVVREELATQLVAWEAIAIEESDARAASGQQCRERRSGRSGTDDRDIDLHRFHKRMAKRYGIICTTFQRAAPTRSAIALASDVV
jgi:hypothetical protein